MHGPLNLDVCLAEPQQGSNGKKDFALNFSKRKNEQSSEHKHVTTIYNYATVHARIPAQTGMHKTSVYGEKKIDKLSITLKLMQVHQQEEFPGSYLSPLSVFFVVG